MRVAVQTRAASARLRPQRNPAAFSVRAQAQASAPAPVKQLLDDAAGKLGKVRFIVVGDGAILESVSDFGSIRYNDVPSRGTLATIASADKSFECHIILSKVKEVKFAKNRAKTGDYDIYATRFLGEEGKLLLSCALHGKDGQYDPASVAAWGDLASKYGDSVKF